MPHASLADLPEPSAEGTLSTTPLSHVLLYALDEKLTGTIEFSLPSGPAATVLFIEGRATKARTTLVDYYLSRALVDLGFITEEQHATLLPRLLLSEELHGQSLIRKKVITPDQLTLALQVQLLAQMEALSELPSEAIFQYFDGFDALASYGGESSVRLDPYPLVWTCLHKQPPWSHIQPVLTGVGNSALRLVSSADTRRFSFDRAEQAVVDLLKAKPQRLQDLTEAASALPPKTALLLAYCLIVTKQVASVSATPGRPATATPAPPPPLAAAVPPPRAPTPPRAPAAPPRPAPRPPPAAETATALPPTTPPPAGNEADGLRGATAPSEPPPTPRVANPEAALANEPPSSKDANRHSAASDSSRPTAPPPPGHDVPDQARADIIPRMAPPPRIGLEDVHTRSTVPRLVAPSAADIAAFAAQQDPLSKAALQRGLAPPVPRETLKVVTNDKTAAPPAAPQPPPRKTAEIDAVAPDSLDEPFADEK